LPDKDFYFNKDARFEQIRAAYVKHIATMLGFAGLDDVAKRAEAIMQLETAIAEHHWERSQLRDRDRTYNLMSFAELQEKFPGYDWPAHFKAQGISKLEDVNVSTPSAVTPILKVIGETDLAVWRDYLRFHVIDNHAPFLSKELDEASFAFNGTMLQGQLAQRESWKRAVALVGGMGGLGDAVGQLYVAKHFKPEAKAAMDELVENLRTALRMNIEKLDWMGEETKAEAYRKLETFNPKIGYTKKWRDYSKVSIVADDLIANLLALRQFGIDEQNGRLGTKPDRDEWFMTPQTVNAYYNASFNEIVFPAGILQPPFFDVNADPAVNYGAIGGVIGHEMGHGFDDQGSKSDSAGVQRNWWTDEDRARFEARTKALVAQYNSYCPLEGHCVNGQLALGENIGDLGGLSMAYTAYKLSLDGKEAPVIDGLTGDQRFFLAWAQVWKSKYRDEAMINQVKVGPHSPPQYRINGPLRNLNEWYDAFDVQAGDALYLPPAERVRIW
jgi:predicted metalloendopeptidase